MHAPIDYKTSPLYGKYLEFAAALRQGSIEESLRELVSLRASQMNACGFCVDMHVKKASKLGERALRLHHVAVWRDSTLFTPRERAALAWTELLTAMPAHGVADEYQRVRAQFSEQEFSDLNFVITAINGWNRIMVAFAPPPGSQDRHYGIHDVALD